MTIRTKVIGRQPTDHGAYVPGQSYGKKYQVELYYCVWESKHDQNNTAPATLNTSTGVITPNTTDWKKVSGSYDQWLIDNGYKKVSTSNVKDSALNDTQDHINATIVGEIGSDSSENTIKGRIKSLENNVGSGGSVDQRIAAEGALHYLKSETYNKTEVNGLVSTPHQEYVTVSTYASLPASGSEDTIYRVSNYDGTQVAAGVYSEYAWDGTQYVFLCAKSSVGEVFDISEYNNGATYADLSAALGVDGANVPADVRKGGMSVKYVQSSDNKYVQYFCNSQTFTTNISNWERINLEEKVNQLDIAVNGGTVETQQLIEVEAGYWDTHLSTGYVQVGDTFAPTRKASSQTVYSTAKLTVNAGDKFLIKGGLGSRYTGLYVLTNNSNVIVDEVINHTRGEDVIINVQNDGYLYINFMDYDSSLDKAYGIVNVEVEGISEKLDNLIIDVNNNTKSIDTISKEIDGNIVDEESIEVTGTGGAMRIIFFIRNYILDTFVGKKIKAKVGSVTTSGQAPTRPYVAIQFFNVDNQSVGYTNVYPGEDVDIPIPTNTSYANVYGSLSTSSTDYTVEGQKYYFNNVQFYIEDTVDDRLDKLEKGGYKLDLDIIIPSIVYASVGTEMNIWNDTISLSLDGGLSSPKNYVVEWLCNKGIVTERGFRFTPSSSDVGEHICKCTIYDSLSISKIAEKEFTIKVVANNAISSAKNIIYFGDSLGAPTAGNLYKDFRSDRYAGTIPTMLGSRQDTTHYGGTVKYEAGGGYRWQEYATEGRAAYRVNVSNVGSIGLNAVYSITVGSTTTNMTVREVNITSGNGNILLEAPYGAAVTGFPTSGTLTKVNGSGDSSISYTDGAREPNNPLWHNGAIDIANYKTEWLGLTSSDKIDAVIFQFGLNDRGLANTPDVLLGYIDDLYTAFIGDNANCKFIIGLTTTSGNTKGGVGANYGASLDTLEYQDLIYRIKKIYLTLENNESYPNIVLSTPNLYLDRYYGYGLVEQAISQRVQETELVHNNYVHPTTSGYEQMADGQMAAIIAALS